MEIREMKNTGYCRGCDSKLEKGDFVFHTHSYRCRGMDIYLCEDCVGSICDMYIQYTRSKEG